MAEVDPQTNQYKRKRKKTFLRNARKYAKRGYYGRGSRLDADTYQYFVKIMEAYKEGFPTEEEKLDFVNNVFDQTENKELLCCQNQVGCRVIETLLPFVSDSVMERFMKVFGDDLRPLCSDRFATHVLEALLAESTKKSMKTDLEDAQRTKYKDFALKVSKFLLNNLEDYIWDTYGNQVVRKVFQNFAQLPPEDTNAHKKPEMTKSEANKNNKNETNKNESNKSIVKEEETPTEIPQEYVEVLKDYAERLIAWPQFKDLPYNELTSGLLQVLLKALKKSDKKLLKSYLKKLLKESFAPIVSESGEDDKKAIDAMEIDGSTKESLKDSLKENSLKEDNLKEDSLKENSLKKESSKEKSSKEDSSKEESSKEDTSKTETSKEIESWKTTKLPEVFMSKACMMLLETALQVSKSKQFTQIYAKCFSGKLLKLATTRATNFAVQKLLTHVEEKVEFESMFEELSENFQDIIEAGHTGVLLSLTQTCKRLSSKQGNVVQSLMKALDCFQPEERQNNFVVCLSRFKTYEACRKETTENLQKERLNLHGTLILQLILEFNKPIKIVNSILSMEVNDVKNLFSNTMGSHIVDSYVKSQYVGEKSREKLVKKMQGTYQDLASTKFGSRSFEAIFNAANPKFKMMIMNELSFKDGSWTHSEFGKIISSKVNYPLYKRNKEEWKASLDKPGKTKNLLDFLEI